MKKWIWVSLAVVVVIGGLVVLTLSNLGPIVRTAVNTEGPDITRTRVHVDSVGISLLSGNADLKGLFVGNPKGFSAPDAIKVGSVVVSVDKKTLGGNPIVINQIAISSPDITYERTGSTDNFQAILDNVRRATGGGNADTSKPSQAASSGKKLLIRDFIIKKGVVALYLPAGQTVTAELPEIQLRDIGGKNGGIEPARAAEVMLAAVYKEIRSPQVLSSLTRQLDKLNIHVDGLDVQSLSRKLNEATGGVAGHLKGLLGNQ